MMYSLLVDRLIMVCKLNLLQLCDSVCKVFLILYYGYTTYPNPGLRFATEVIYAYTQYKVVKGS